MFKDCNFCGHDINKHGGKEGCEKGHGGEWRKCHEEERCFNKTFECREKKIIECREKHCG